MRWIARRFDKLKALSKSKGSAGDAKEMRAIWKQLRLLKIAQRFSAGDAVGLMGKSRQGRKERSVVPGGTRSFWTKKTQR